MADDLPELILPGVREWTQWLEAEHADSRGVWLILTKKGGTLTTLTYAEALDEVLCFGWIDGQRRGRDSESYLQRFTPRTPKSIWSIRNCASIERLTAEGRMRPAGLAAVEAARADGRWDRAYAGPATAVVPDDLAAAVAASPPAQAAFDGLSSQNRYALIFRLGQVHTPAGRQRAVERFVGMLERGETPYPQKR
ncbi:YdeI/OmpD-associated family protein [Arthrobacter zhaoguopingii]|uniref:YdeI/OmpD-associated family protein n=1 Tax=Arthrobacter zhaoguopingii TaxID=2681491 RepID=UPI001359151D|nr:YdeI/OmpD-associated family protein [Arthrobacter zhaoguopingii]